MVNLLTAFSNFAKNPIAEIGDYYRSPNRANNMGEALEFYIKDLFCGTVGTKDINKKHAVYSKYFSYAGNQNNPPDFMIRGGDAVEVKKVESFTAGIALNSSYPKDRLYAASPMITKDCRNCEKWKEKDLIYAVDVLKKKKLKALWFVYGDCYAAGKDTYERIKKSISAGLAGFEGVGFSKTKELGRVNKVDPLGITYLRIRGMWHIASPMKVFNYIVKPNNEKVSAYALILKAKYNSFPVQDRKVLEKMQQKNFSISDVKIKSPNNPAKLLEAKLLSFTK
ncbi:MAG: restriction endonuclease [Candidatus Harrisonbacteria bacterium CG10_big_fil_rev_8_21_14_0_10_42_17]|uniref:Restriction endonuclease n=1 Tax=Candidatus Harrisonbacteria bacterium CG10_big_fil_rev_8_21_14_0_10_42_17 TaxID=1974584 RepID=A0A2M6WID6_9BACT|nr:MAG: restriction endonuclease [Candidatus Harrisonbacteria bacterium CG10_big_fil_rev_8_21_14_0_10_42_17]